MKSGFYCTSLGHGNQRKFSIFLLQSIYLDEPVSKKSASVELEEVNCTLLYYYFVN